MFSTSVEGRELPGHRRVSVAAGASSPTELGYGEWMDRAREAEEFQQAGSELRSVGQDHLPGGVIGERRRRHHHRRVEEGEMEAAVATQHLYSQC